MVDEAARLRALVERMTARVPRSREAEALRMEAEHALMRIVTSGGARGVRQAITALKKDGHELVPTFHVASVREWRTTRDGRVLTIHTNTSRIIKSAGISYAVVPPPLTRAQAARARVHERFYARYRALPRDRRLNGDDRLVRDVGDFEADWNNGGFDQYIGNKGRRRAAMVVRDLEQVGARRSARLLAAALATSDPAERDRLDQEMHGGYEDLAGLVMRHLEGGRR